MFCVTFIIRQYASQFVEKVSKQTTKKLTHARTVKKYEESFNESFFAEKAQKIYIDAHNALMKYLISLFFFQN